MPDTKPVVEVVPPFAIDTKAVAGALVAEHAYYLIAGVLVQQSDQGHYLTIPEQDVLDDIEDYLEARPEVIPADETAAIVARVRLDLSRSARGVVVATNPTYTESAVREVQQARYLNGRKVQHERTDEGLRVLHESIKDTTVLASDLWAQFQDWWASTYPDTDLVFRNYQPVPHRTVMNATARRLFRGSRFNDDRELVFNVPATLPKGGA